MFWNTMALYGNLGFSQNAFRVILVLAAFDFILKAFSLWRSARREEKAWFVALLLVNSLGILPLIYLLTHPEAKTKRK